MMRGVIVGRYITHDLRMEATREAMKSPHWSTSVAHRAAFRVGYIAHVSGRKREENCYAATGFRSAWFDGWDHSASINEIITFSTDLAVEP